MLDVVLLDAAYATAPPSETPRAHLPVLPLQSQESLPASAKQADYVLRRLDLWTHQAERDAFADVSVCLPLPQQTWFRRKLLLVFALQLLLVGAAVGAATFCAPVRDRVTPLFAHRSPELLVACAVAVVGLLLLLYVVRNRRGVNLFVLLLFSAAQAATFTGLGVVFETNLGFFNCGATLAWVLLLALLSGVRVDAESDVDSVMPRRLLMSPLAAGAMAYVLVVAVSCALFAVYGASFVTGAGFGLSLLFQLALLAWFAWDAAYMFEVMAADEFSHGVIYLYTDAVLTAVFCLALVAAVLGFTVFMVLLIASAGEGADGCDCNCDCGSCLAESCDSFVYITDSGSSSGGNCCDCTCDCRDCKCCRRRKPPRHARTTTSSTARTTGTELESSSQEAERGAPELHEAMQRV